MNCSKCGNGLDAGAKFCANCGAAVVKSETAKNMFCENCGTQIEAGAKFCEGCGKNQKGNVFTEAQADLPSQPQGAVIYSDKANYFCNGNATEAVGGNLYLHDNMLVFKANALNLSALNLKEFEVVIELSKIKDVSFFNTLGFISNGLAINLQNSTVDKFVVSNRKTWKSEIEKLL